MRSGADLICVVRSSSSYLLRNFLQSYGDPAGDQPLIGQFFTCINKKQAERKLPLLHPKRQRLLLKAISFPGQPFDPVPVHRLLKIPLAGAKTSLQPTHRSPHHIIDPEGKNIHAPPFTEDPLYLLAALEPLTPA